jgi:hypothetical protein
VSWVQTNLNEPPPLNNNGVPYAWPKRFVLAAPQYVGWVDYYFYCGNILGADGNWYFSCIPPTLSWDIVQAVNNWFNADSSNGSTAQFHSTDGPPPNPQSSPLGDCVYPGYTGPCQEPSIQFRFVEPADLPPNAGASTSPAFGDYGWGSFAPPGVPSDYFRLNYAQISFNNQITDDYYMQGIAEHEIGHTFSLDDCYTCNGTTVMLSGVIPLNWNLGQPTGPSYCDNQQVSSADFASLLYRTPGLRQAVQLARVNGRAPSRSEKPQIYESGLDAVPAHVGATIPAFIQKPSE